MSSLEDAYRRFVDGLPASTGRTMEEWTAEIRRNGPPKYRERVEWLTTHYQFAYRPACMLALQAGKATDYSDGAALIEAMYRGPQAALRPIHDALMHYGRALSPDVTETVCKTFVSLKRKYVFAQVKPATKTRIDLGLALPPTKTSGRLIATGGHEKGDRISYRIPISSVDQIDSEVRAWVRKAWELTPSGA